MQFNLSKQFVSSSASLYAAKVEWYVISNLNFSQSRLYNSR